VSLYRLKRTLLAPRTAYMRRKERRQPHLARTMLEQQYYRRAVYDFMAATSNRPDLLVDLDVDEGSLVFDVGAFRGDWARQISARHGSTIHTFEPNPHAFARLTARLRVQPKIVTHDYGLGGRDLQALLTVAGPGSSIYGVDAGGAPLEQVRVTIRDIARVLDELEIDAIDLLKVNIEGGEYDLLDRLIETGWLPRIRLVLVQFHEWHPNAYRRRRAIRRALRGSHDEEWNHPFVWELWRRRT
jgi:FkbM family methyltransferase